MDFKKLFGPLFPKEKEIIHFVIFRDDEYFTLHETDLEDWKTTSWEMVTCEECKELIVYEFF